MVHLRSQGMVQTVGVTGELSPKTTKIVISTAKVIVYALSVSQGVINA